MIKTLLLNILIKRGASAVEEIIGKSIRHGLTTAGGGLMAQGIADSSDVTAITGGALAISGVLVSLARIWVQNKV